MAEHDNMADNGSTIAYLVGEAIKGRLVVFVGAGCSKQAGIPTWEELLTRVQGDQKDLRLPVFLDWAQNLEWNLGAAEFRRKLVENLKSKPEYDRSFHRAIAKLPTNLFITTNFDTLLEESLFELGYSPRVIVNQKDIPSILPSEKTVVKIHGDIQVPSSIVITSDDYEHYSSTREGFSLFLKGRFAEGTILFLGTSFADPRLRYINEEVFKLFGPDRREAVLVLKRPGESDPEKSQFDFTCIKYRNMKLRLHIIDEYEEIEALCLNIIKEFEHQSRFGKHPSMPTLSHLQDELAKSDNKYLKELILNCYSGSSIKYHVNQETLNSLEIFCKEDSKSPKDRVIGLITLTDYYLNIGEIDKAEIFIQLAESLNQNNLVKKANLSLRLFRAQVCVYKQDFNSAYAELKNEKDPAVFRHLLMILISLDKRDELEKMVGDVEKIPIEIASSAGAALTYLGREDDANRFYDIAITQLASDENILPFMAEYAYYVMHALISINSGNTIKLIKERSDTILRKMRDVASKVIEKASDKSLVIKMARKARLNANYMLGDATKSLEDALELFDMRGPTARDEIVYDIIFNSLNQMKVEKKQEVIKRLKELSDDFLAQLYLLKYYAHIEETGNKEDVDKCINRLMVLSKHNIARSKDMLDIIHEIIYRYKRIDAALELENRFANDEPHKYYLKATRYTYELEYDKAKEQLTSVLDSSGKSPYLSFLSNKLLANIFLMQNENGEALTYYESALRIVDDMLLYRNYLKALVNVRNSFDGVRQATDIGEIRDKIIVVAKRVLENDSNDLLTLGILATEYVQGMKYAEALEIIKRMKSIIDEKMDRNAKDNCITTEDCRKYITYTNNESYILNKMERTGDIIDCVMSADRYVDWIRINDPKEYMRIKDKIYSIKNSHVYALRQTGREQQAIMVLINVVDSYQLDKEYFRIFPNDLVYLIATLPRNDKKYAVLHENAVKLMSEMMHDEEIMRRAGAWKCSIDEFKGIIEQRSKNLSDIYDGYLKGIAPRLFISRQHSNHPFYYDWFLRTRNRNSTYASDRIRILENKGKYLSQMMEVPCKYRSENSDRIVIDYSALITLHQLEDVLGCELIRMLPKVFRGGVYYPAEFIMMLEKETPEFDFFDRRKAEAAIRLSRAHPNSLSAYSVKNPVWVTSEQLAREKEWPILLRAKVETSDTQHKDVSVVYVCEIADWLYTKGVINDNLRKQIRQRYEWNEATDVDKVSRNLSTKRIVCSFECAVDLEILGLCTSIESKNIQIALVNTEYEKLVKFKSDLDMRAEAKERHKKLLDLINNCGLKAAQVDSSIQDRIKSKEITMSPLNLAISMQIPLLSDERAFNKVVDENTKWSCKRWMQFDTYALLHYLYKAHKIDIVKFSKAALQLMEWRYYFNVPDAELLVYWLKNDPRIPSAEIEVVSECIMEQYEDAGFNKQYIVNSLQEEGEVAIPFAIRFSDYCIEEFGKSVYTLITDKALSGVEKVNITEYITRALMLFVPEFLNEEEKQKYICLQYSKLYIKIFDVALRIEVKVDLEALRECMLTLEPLLGKNEIDRHRTFLLFCDILGKHNDKMSDNERDATNILLGRLKYLVYGNSNEIIVHGLLADDAIKVLERTKRVNCKRIEGRDEMDVESRAASVDNLPNVRLSEWPTIVAQLRSDNIKDRKHALSLALKTYSDDTWITEITKSEFEQRSNRIISNLEHVRKTAVEEIVVFLMKDYKFLTKMLRHVMRSESIVQNGRLLFPHYVRSEALTSHLLSPDIQTVKECLPDIFRCGTIDKAKEELLKMAREHSFENIAIALDQYCMQYAFTPLDYPLDPFAYLLQLREIAESDGKPRDVMQYIKEHSEELGGKIMEWADQRTDSNSVTVAIAILLSIRGASFNESTRAVNRFYRGEYFYNWLNKKLLMLMPSPIENSIKGKPILYGSDRESQVSNMNDTDTPSDVLNSRLHRSIWRFNVLLHDHFIKYIDIVGKYYEEYQKVHIACYLAYNAVQVFSDFRMDVTLSQRIEWIERVSTEIKKEPAFFETEMASLIRSEKISRVGLSRVRLNLSNPSLLCSLPIFALLRSSCVGDDNRHRGLLYRGIELHRCLYQETIDRIMDVYALSLRFGMGYGTSHDRTNESFGDLVLLSWPLPDCIDSFLEAYFPDQSVLPKEFRILRNCLKNLQQPTYLNKEVDYLQTARSDTSEYQLRAILLFTHIANLLRLEIPCEDAMSKIIQLMAGDSFSEWFNSLNDDATPFIEKLAACLNGMHILGMQNELALVKNIIIAYIESHSADSITNSNLIHAMDSIQKYCITFFDENMLRKWRRITEQGLGEEEWRDFRKRLEDMIASCPLSVKHKLVWAHRILTR